MTARKLLIGLGIAVAAVAAAMIGGLGNAHAVPIPPVTYSIIGNSGSHQISLLNLPVGQPGVLEVPTPVDVNGDLLPDVEVSVNLVNVNGVFHNPPQLGSIVAPEIQIDRLVTAPVLGQASPPLNIEVSLQFASSSGGPPTVLKFGYNTGIGGTIPTYFHAVVGGLTSFFNPLQAVVDTTGTVLGLQPNINGLGLAPVAPPYQGPLHVIGGITSGSNSTNLDFAFRPFPQTATVGYSTDSAGQHFTYADAYSGQVDLTASATSVSSTSTSNFSARVDRLPQSLAIDYANGGAQNTGSVDLRSTPSGRLPDVGLTIATTSTGARPLNADLNISALPPVMHADWSLPPGGPAHAAFCAPAAPSSTPCSSPQGAGIGSIQGQVTNFAPGASSIVPYVPDQEQYLNFQAVGTDPKNQDELISANVERVRTLNFTQTPTGLDATAALGDGELPLEAHFVTDGRAVGASGPYTEASAMESPLPANAHIDLQLPAPGSASSAPIVLTYGASDAVDVTGSFKTFSATATGTACGATGSACGSVQAYHIPSQVVTTIVAGQSQTQINVDSTQTGTVVDEPDFIADATIGQTDPLHPIVAHAELLGFPKAVTIDALQDANGGLSAAEFHACDWNESASPPACAGEQTEGNIGQLSFDIHNWLSRPTSPALPEPHATTPDYADVIARGVASNPHLVLFEAAGQVTNISEVDYRDVDNIGGVRVDAGGGSPFSTHVDIGNVDPDPTTAGTHRFSGVADVNIDHLPSQMDICFRQPNQPLATTGASFTSSCEDQNPFQDSSPLTSSPATFSFRANAPFRVASSATVVDEGADSALAGSDVGVSDDRTYKATVDIGQVPTNSQVPPSGGQVPQNITVNLQMPPSGQTGAIRAIYCAGSVLPPPGHAPPRPAAIRRSSSTPRLPSPIATSSARIRGPV